MNLKRSKKELKRSKRTTKQLYWQLRRSLLTKLKRPRRRLWNSYVKRKKS